MTRHELSLEIPAEWWINANMRLHWTKRSARTANLRMLALSECQKQRLIKGLESARITAWITYPTKAKHDPNNDSPTTKALVDGLVDYGVLPDDDHLHLAGPDHRYAGVTPGRYTVRMVIENATLSDTRPAIGGE